MIKKTIKNFSFLLIVLCILFTFNNKVSAYEQTHDSNYTKDGYHLELFSSIEHKHSGTPTYCDYFVCAVAHNLNPTDSQLLSSVSSSNPFRLTGNLLINQTYPWSVDFSQTSYPISSNVLWVKANNCDMDYVYLASPYNNGGTGKTGYAYFYEYYSWCTVTNKYYYLGSSHYWLATSPSGGGIIEEYMQDYTHTINTYNIVPNSYTIRLHSNYANGTDDVVNVSTTFDTSVNLPDNTFAQNGYVYKGWNADKSKTYGSSYNIQYTNNQSVTNLTNVNGGVVDLYAVWDKIPEITTRDFNWDESTEITDEMLLDGITATDSEDGNLTSSIKITSHGDLDLSKAKVGTYNISYYVKDSNGSATTATSKVNINNVPPTITAPDKSWDEASIITNEMLMENVTASDPYDGDLTSGVSIVSYGGLENYMQKAKAGTYQVTYAVTDSNGATTNQIANITINNVPPEINIMESYEYLYGTTMTEKRVRKLILSASDVYDGDLTSQVYIVDLDGMLLDDTSNWHRAYTVTYAVADSNGAITPQTGIVQITYKYIRSISAKYLYTIEDDSRWKDPELFAILSEIMLRDPNDDSQCEQVWYFSNEDRLAIQKHVTENPRQGEELNQWFLDNYLDRKIIDNTDKLGQ